mmetsp:Transcript_32816/g.50111  ORF Transcript_32816/g.50111 Transcript_32816/m.50111 type:complete len:161 (-) Transcript_32816:1978-2460(-)
MRGTGSSFNSAALPDARREIGSQILKATALEASFEVPGKKDYDILFHEQEYYRFSLNAQEDQLSILVTSSSDLKMWKGDFPSSYLEDISRKTGREVNYKQFVDLLHRALLCHQSNKDQREAEKRHIFIDLLCYQDLQLLKAKKGQGMKALAMSTSSNIDP